MLAIGGTSYGLMRYAMSRPEKHPKKMPVTAIRNAIGRDLKAPIVEAKGMNNAMYAPGEVLDEGMVEQLGEMGAKIPKRKLRAAQQHGLVVVDPDAGNDAVVAHEFGHARDWKDNNRSMLGYRLSLALAPLLGGAAGAVAGHYLPGTSPGHGVRGVAAGAAAGILGGLVAGSYGLKREYDASDNAEEYISKTKDPDARRNRLRAAYTTYLLATLGMGAVVGGSLGGLFSTIRARGDLT
jgi:Zn-dependent protease with chaperone function